MKITISNFQYELRTANNLRMGEGRTKEIHLSDILRWMRVRMEGEFKGDNPNFAMMGFVFEVLLAQSISTYLIAQRDTVISPGECEMDGIWLTPDGLDVASEILEEYKATWKTMRKIDDLEGEFWYWLAQIKAYCRALGTRKARLIALFVNGNYTYCDPDGGPRLKSIDLEFTAQEIEENWTMILNNRRAMVKEGWKPA
jgi:hypothetical protein